MSEGVAFYKRGEKRPVYGEAIVTGSSLATLTISATPTVSIYDSTGAVLTDFNGIDVTGSDAGALTTVRAWLDIDTTSPYAFPVGWFTVVFNIHTQGSDGLGRVHEPSVLMWVSAVTS